MAFAALLPLLRRICLPDAENALLAELDAASGRLAADVDRNVAAITAIDSELQVWDSSTAKRIFWRRRNTLKSGVEPARSSKAVQISHCAEGPGMLRRVAPARSHGPHSLTWFLRMWTC